MDYGVQQLYMIYYLKYMVILFAAEIFKDIFCICVFLCS